jgi:hypothetical protein
VGEIFSIQRYGEMVGLTGCIFLHKDVLVEVEPIGPLEELASGAQASSSSCLFLFIPPPAFLFSIRPYMVSCDLLFDAAENGRKIHGVCHCVRSTSVEVHGVQKYPVCSPTKQNVFKERRFVLSVPQASFQERWGLTKVQFPADGDSLNLDAVKAAVAMSAVPL